MAVVKCAVAILVAFLVQGGESLTIDVSVPQTRSSGSMILQNTIANTFLTYNINQLNVSVGDVQTNLKKLIVDGQTDDLRDAAKLINRVVGRAVELGNRFTGALTNMATDKTIPVEELFEQFEKVYNKLKKYVTTDRDKYLHEINELMGCAVARDFESSLRGIGHEIAHIASIVDRLKEAVLDKDDRHDHHKGENPASIAHLVDVLSKSIVKMKSKVADFATSVGNTITGLQTANTFLTQIFGTKNTTRMGVRTSRDDLRKAVKMERRTALENYYGAQSKIRTDLSSSIAKLSMFSPSRRLYRLSKQFDESYHRLYNFLRGRNRTDASHIGRYFHFIADNSDEIIDKTADIFFRAMRRTTLKLTDIVMERSSYADTCYTTYSTTLSGQYQSLSTLITDCTTREKPRWASISKTILAVVSLLQTNAEELSTNIARCATYTNFITTSADYVQANACLKTNLEDLDELSEVLKPQFENIDTLVKVEVGASKYRLENCFVTRLHELTALLKSTRASIGVCAGRFDDCTRKNHEDDDGDWFDRRRGEDCEDDDDDKGNKGRDSGEVKRNEGKKNCKKRDKDEKEEKYDSDEEDSSEKKDKDKKDKKDEKDKKDKDKKDSHEEDSGEKKDKDKKDKDKKDKDKKDKDKKDKDKKDKDKNKDKRDSHEVNSEEEDSREKKDKKKKDKNDKDKYGSHEEDSREDDSREKKDKKKKDKNDKDKFGSNEEDSREDDSREKKDKKKKDKNDKDKYGSHENESREDDSREKKDKNKKDKKDKDKYGSHESESREDDSREKKHKKDKKDEWDGENSEEEFDRKHKKGYSEEEILNQNSGIKPETISLVQVKPSLGRILENPVSVENEKEQSIASDSSNITDNVDQEKIADTIETSTSFTDDSTASGTTESSIKSNNTN